VLWGAQARKKKSLIDLTRHAVVESPHPSPLSAHQGFIGSRPFSQINAALHAGGLSDIDWALD
jgi:uracil-DNA glycosylase